MDAPAIYRDSLVWDDHCGFEMLPDAPLAPLLKPWREAGVDYLSINVGYDVKAWTRTIENIAALRRRLPTEAPFCRLVSTVSEIDQARADGKLAVTFDIEGMDALAGRTDMVQLYYDLGVRHMLFAYNRNNLAGSGCHDEDTGLTDFGRQVIVEMNRVGMVVDCSHSGFKTTMAAMEISADPVVFSHSNPKALVDHGRNITDEQIKACAATGGVIGINGVNLFLGEEVPSPSNVARHAAYIAELTGPEHVGLSLDFAPKEEDTEDDASGNQESSDVSGSIARNPHYWPPGTGYEKGVSYLDIRRLPDIATELATVGFRKSEIAGILGGNFRRIAEQVWK
ncbi:dipeptidase [Pelagibius sp. Alg239-R121]|uniref:dipeptidase n=1 Tax=Pelagibius sp. Alg239-R121 TaxID=2993448 RepID=UPI0024A76EC8|nr:membrane dipeptidase [Pelagibius sp. Alg239-R121]